MGWNTQREAEPGNSVSVCKPNPSSWTHSPREPSSSRGGSTHDSHLWTTGAPTATDNWQQWQWACDPASPSGRLPSLALPLHCSDWMHEPSNTRCGPRLSPSPTSQWQSLWLGTSWTLQRHAPSRSPGRDPSDTRCSKAATTLEAQWWYQENWATILTEMEEESAFQSDHSSGCCSVTHPSHPHPGYLTPGKRH